MSLHNSTFQAIDEGSAFGKWLAKKYATLGLNYAFKSASMITGCSPDVILGISRLSSIPKEKSRVLYYGVKLVAKGSEIERRAFREKLGMPANALIIIHVGRFADQKNHTQLIESSQHIISEYGNVYFLLVGDGPLKEGVEQLVVGKSLQEKVIFLGLRRDVDYLLSMADIFFFPSKFEGLPVSALEAAGAGLPMVGSDVHGIRLQ